MADNRDQGAPLLSKYTQRRNNWCLSLDEVSSRSVMHTVIPQLAVEDILIRFTPQRLNAYSSSSHQIMAPWTVNLLVFPFPTYADILAQNFQSKPSSTAVHGPELRPCKGGRAFEPPQHRQSFIFPLTSSVLPLSVFTMLYLLRISTGEKDKILKEISNQVVFGTICPAERFVMHTNGHWFEFRAPGNLWPTDPAHPPLLASLRSLCFVTRDVLGSFAYGHRDENGLLHVSGIFTSLLS
jgi:hypothetical protein